MKELARKKGWIEGRKEITNKQTNKSSNHNNNNNNDDDDNNNNNK